MHLASPSGLRHTGPISGIAAQGAFVATAGYDNQVILWDAARREALARACHDHLVNHCAFSPDGRWLVTASSDHTARVWELPALKLRTVLAGHGDDVDMAAFSPDGRRIATCALDRCVRVFDFEGRCLHEMHGHTGNVLSLAWSADGRHVVSSSVDGTLRTWDTEQGACVRVTTLGARSDSVEIGADGVLFAGDDFGRIVVVESDEAQYTQAHQAGIKRIALDAGHRLLATLSYDGTMALWAIDSAHGLLLQARTPLPHAVWARAAVVLDDGRVAAGTFGGTYALYDPEHDTWDLDGAGAGGAVNAVLAVDGALLTVGDAGEVRCDGVAHSTIGSLCNFLVAQAGRVFTGGQLGRLFDAGSGRVLFQHHSPLNCGIAFERRGVPCIAIGSYTGEILLFEVGDDALTLVQTIAAYENAVKGLSCSDGLLFSVCASTDIAWHRIDDGVQVRRVNRAHARIANACCTIGPGRFATVGRDRMLRLWLDDQAETHASPHPNSIKCMAVDAGHRTVLTGSYGGTVAAFDIATRRWSRLRRLSASGISSMTWDAAGGRFVAAAYDGSTHPVSVEHVQ